MKANIYIDFPSHIYYEMCIKDVDEKVNPAYAIAQDKSRNMSAVSGFLEVGVW